MSAFRTVGYHADQIPNGVLGEFSKIEEEFLEAKDAFKQGSKLMLLMELSDLIGAIEHLVVGYGMQLQDLLVMKDLTNRAFSSGQRKAKGK